MKLYELMEGELGMDARIISFEIVHDVMGVVDEDEEAVQGGYIVRDVWLDELTKSNKDQMSSLVSVMDSPLLDVSLSQITQGIMKMMEKEDCGRESEESFFAMVRLLRECEVELLGKMERLVFEFSGEFYQLCIIYVLPNKKEELLSLVRGLL